MKGDGYVKLNRVGPPSWRKRKRERSVVPTTSKKKKKKKDLPSKTVAAARRAPSTRLNVRTLVDHLNRGGSVDA